MKTQKVFHVKQFLECLLHANQIEGCQAQSGLIMSYQASFGALGWVVGSVSGLCGC